MAKYEAFKWLDGTREIKTRIVSAISSHYSRRHWFVFHIGTKYWFRTFVKFSLFIPYIHTRTHTLSKNSFGQARGSFNDISVWYKSVARSAGFASGCVYTALLINGLSLSPRKCSKSGMAETHSILSSRQESGSSGWASARWKEAGSVELLSAGFITPPSSQAWGLSRVIGAVNLEEQRGYSWAQSNKDKQ